MRFFYSRAPDNNLIIQVFNLIESTTILGWRSVCFVRCLPSYKSLSGPIFWQLWLCLCITQVKIMLSVVKKLLIECLRAQITRKKTTVPAITFGVPMKSASPYLNPHISAELRRMQTIKRPYFIVISRRCTFRSQKYFLLPSSPPTVMMTSW